MAGSGWAAMANADIKLADLGSIKASFQSQSSGERVSKVRAEETLAVGDRSHDVVAGIACGTGTG